MKFALSLLIITNMLTGCVSMEAIQDYSSQSHETIQSTNLLAKDFYTSCTRTNNYKPYKLISECQVEKDASTSIIKVASTLDAYSLALGSISSDELIDYSADTAKLTTEIKSLKGADKKQLIEDQKIDSIEKLANIIAKAATDAYRQKETVKLIKSSNKTVGEVSNTLAELIDEHYTEAIKLEISAWEKSYQKIEVTERSKKPLEWEKYSESQWKKRSNLELKLSSAKSLSKSIRSIGTTHDKLYKDAENITGEEVQASVRAFINEAKPAIKDVQAAFFNN